MRQNGSLPRRVGAHRQERCRERVVDGSKHGDALVVSIQVELQSFALQAAHAMLLVELHRVNQARKHVRQFCQVEVTRHAAAAMIANMTKITACLLSGSVEMHMIHIATVIPSTLPDNKQAVGYIMSISAVPASSRYSQDWTEDLPCDLEQSNPTMTAAFDHNNANTRPYLSCFSAYARFCCVTTYAQH